MALSIAEQSLAETRLKLVMTESELDELEFQWYKIVKYDLQSNHIAVAYFSYFL